VTFVEKTGALPPTLLQPYLSTLDPVDSDGVPRFETVTISGPYNATGAGDTPSRRRVFTCRPAANAGLAAETACARQIITAFARRAYRRPVHNADVEPVLAFYERGRAKGGFDAGVQLAVQRILSDPEFVFRAEKDPSPGPRTAQRISDLELASRLSFFLWSSVPDDELLTAAARGRLKEPQVLERQVRRMLADSRASALVANFAGQWLYLRNLRNVVPSKDAFPDFDDNLRQALQRETELLIEHVMKQDRSVIELLTADFTFVNERLARHYGIPGVAGGEFRKVQYPDNRRIGVLGQGSMLVQTSLANRTSPVLRGKWVMEVLLGTPPPPPPPDVPDLEASGEAKDGRMLTTRERMEIHRKNPTCNSCHRFMDPIGLALDNFDVTGRYRLRENGMPLDTRGDFFDGTPVNNLDELVAAILKRPETLVRNFTDNLMAYGLGRRVEFYDQPTIRRISKDAAATDYRMSSFILGVIKSEAFRFKKVDEPATTTTEAAQQHAGQR
jgi:hypothetical protein